MSMHSVGKYCFDLIPLVVLVDLIVVLFSSTLNKTLFKIGRVARLGVAFDNF